MEFSEKLMGSMNIKKKKLREKGKFKWSYLEYSFIPNILEFVSCLQIYVSL